MPDARKPRDAKRDPRPGDVWRRQRAEREIVDVGETINYYRGGGKIHGTWTRDEFSRWVRSATMVRTASPALSMLDSLMAIFGFYRKERDA